MGGALNLGAKITYSPLASMNFTAFDRVVRGSLAMYVKAFSYSFGSPYKARLHSTLPAADATVKLQCYKQSQRLHPMLVG